MSYFKYILSVISALCICSCAMDNTLQYNNVTMGNFVDGKFISDQGLTFNIVDRTCSESIDTLKRAMISCDILSRAGNEGYDVRLTGVDAIFTKNPVDSTSVVNDTDIMVENPLNIGEMWYSAGYLNLLIYIPIKENSSTPHLINLVRNDKKAGAAVYQFTLKHNAFGEIITAEDNDFVIAGTYVSFPVSQLFKADEKKVQIIINWTSNEEKEGKLNPETKKNTISLEVERGGFEHKL